MKDDVLWMSEIEAVVNEVDPIRGLIKVTLATNVQLDVGPEELEKKRPEPQKVSTRKKGYHYVRNQLQLQPQLHPHLHLNKTTKNHLQP